MAPRRGIAPCGAPAAVASGRASGALGQQDPLIARDRAGHTVDAVLPDLGAEAIGGTRARGRR